MSSNALTWLFCIGIGQAFVALPPIRRALAKLAPSLFGRVLCGLLLGYATHCAGTKGGGEAAATRLSQFVTALRSGAIIDESGLVARSSEAAVLRSYGELSREIIGAASGTVAQAHADFSELAGLVTNTERRLIYLTSDLPRAWARGWTNHNIAATVERVRQTPDLSTLNMWVWFSEQPVVAPGMAAEIDLGAGWVKLTAQTNSYPNTESVNGVPCVRYDFDVPAGARGVVFRPSYEVAFGHEAAPLLVPSAGILVTTGAVSRLPFTGTDRYFSNRVEVTYSGGIATGLKIDGETRTNGVWQL